MAISAIPTKYGGVNFRSRLEAKWASMFDLLGWRWDYEPVDLDGWIPDFRLNFYRPIYVEVKPANCLKDLEQYKEKIQKAQPRAEVLLVGSFLFEDGEGFENGFGLLGEPLMCLNSGRLGEIEVFWATAKMQFCDACFQYSFGDVRHGIACSVSGCYERLGHLNPDKIRSLWHDAGNSAQWKGKGSKTYARQKASRLTIEERLNDVLRNPEKFGIKRCTLCREPLSSVCIFHPNEEFAKKIGQPGGKQRLVAYGLCKKCSDNPDHINAIEQGILVAYGLCKKCSDNPDHINAIEQGILQDHELREAA